MRCSSSAPLPARGALARRCLWVGEGAGRGVETIVMVAIYYTQALGAFTPEETGLPACCWWVYYRWYATSVKNVGFRRRP